MYVAKLSLSHRSFHHCIVTRLPNHWCAISCDMTSAMYCFVLVDEVFGSYSSMASRNVMAPQFSMAPAAKSGIAIRSSFGRGYFIPKYSSYSLKSRLPRSSAYSGLFSVSFGSDYSAPAFCRIFQRCIRIPKINKICRQFFQIYRVKPRFLKIGKEIAQIVLA